MRYAMMYVVGHFVDYFEVFNLSVLNPYAFSIASFVSVFEKYDLATTPNNKPIISPIKISRLNRFIVIITF